MNMNIRTNNFGIGIEKEIFSEPYFSFHYGYKKAKTHNMHKKLCRIENCFFPYLRKVPFHISSLNISKKGNHIFLVIKRQEDKKIFEKELQINLIGNPSGIAIKIEDLPKKDKVIRQLYTTVNSLEFSLSTESKKIVENIVEELDPKFVCFGLNSYKNTLFYDEIHLEIYPKDDIENRKNIIKYLNLYTNNTKNLEKYIYNFKRFSHLKFRIKNEEIDSIKYYRSINVDIPDYYASN